MLPFTVKVKAAPPAVTLAGDIDEIDGTGVDPVTANVAVLDVPPPGAGFTTVTFAVTGELIAMVGTVPVSLVLLV